MVMDFEGFGPVPKGTKLPWGYTKPVTEQVDALKKPSSATSPSKKIDTAPAIGLK